MRVLVVLALGGCGRIAFDPLDDAATSAPGAVAIAAGDTHSCAALNDGRVRCWGANDVGQLGTGILGGYAAQPTEVLQLGDTASLGASELASFAVDRAGAVWAWGYNGEGELGGSFAGMEAALPVQAALLADVEQIAGGARTVCARTASGEVLCWGDGDGGQIGNGTLPDATPPVAATLPGAASALALGTDHGCAIVAQEVYCWGINEDGRVGIDPALSTDTCEAFDTTLHACTLLPVRVPGISGAVAIAAGRAHTCTILDGGAVRCWGYNAEGQLGNGSMLDSFVPVEVSLGPARSIGAGEEETCAALVDGSAWCWGEGLDGELGNGTTTMTLVPVRVAAPVALTAIALNAGGEHVCALGEDGSVWCWGRNDSGEVGDGTLVLRSTPQRVPL